MTLPLPRQRIAALLTNLLKLSPASYPVYYMLLNSYKTKNAWPNISVYTDDRNSPRPTTVVCAANQYHSPPADRSYFFHTTDNAKLRRLLRRPGVIDWDRAEIMFETVPYSSSEVIEEVCRERGYRRACEEKCCLFLLQNTDTVQNVAGKPVPDGLTAGRVTANQAPLLENRWWEANDTPPPNFTQSLKYGHANALFDSSGRPVSWCMFKEYGDIGVGFTEPEYRGQGLAKIVFAKTVMEVLKQGLLPYGIIEITNYSSLRAAEGLGFERHENYFSAWWVYKKTKPNEIV